MSYELIQAPSFWDCLRSLRRDDTYKAALMESLLELHEQPFKNPKLQTHDIGKDRHGKTLFSSDVGGRRSDRRLVWQLFNKTIVVLLYGTHAVQARAKRMRIDFDPAERVVAVFEEAPGGGVERNYQQQRVEIGTLFMAWTDNELAALGFNEPTVAVLRKLDTDDELLAIESSLGSVAFEKAYNLLAYGNAEGELADLGPVEEADEPEPTDEDLELERQLDDPRAGAWFTRAEPEYLAEVLNRPIEDWMIFLHPDQRVLVSRQYEGPARVRGSAGTGKTVVGLHRAAWLAQRNRSRGESKPILFTTFIKSLPPVFESLYLRLPGTEPGEVEFVHISRLASQVCASAGDKQVTAFRRIDAAYASAYRRVVTTGTPLADGGFGRQYLRDEISAVVKGRGLSSLDAYLEVSRTGRRAPMNRRHREQVWDLMREWDAEMKKRGTVDFADVVLRARDHARELAEPRYSAAIVDEAQDLSLAGLQLVRALVNAPGSRDQPNGLLLLGDGAQRIYAGGFKLRQAGVEVRGRTALLRVNYRNTAEIIGTAMAVAGDGAVDDLAEEFRRGDEAAEPTRTGDKPIVVKAKSLDAQLDAIVDQVRGLTSTDRVGTGDIAVLAPTNKVVDLVLRRLSNSGVAAQDLEDYDGRPNDQVKVGTYHRGKGLEFKAVFLPGLSAGSFPRPPDEGVGAAEAAESRDLAISQLFVAMTRARDVVVLLHDGELTDVVAAQLHRFEQSSV